MSRRTTHLTLILVTQTACVGVGLWIHYHYSLSAARQGVEDRVWLRLDRSAQDALGKARELLSGADAVGDVESTHHSPAVVPMLGAGTMVVDAGWRITHSSLDGKGSTPAAAAAWCSTGRQLEWVPLPDNAFGGSNLLRGQLSTPEGSHLAVAAPLGEGRGYSVASYPVAEIDAQVANVSPSLLAASAVTILWTCALLGITVYMVTSRFYDATFRERKESEALSLQRMEALVRMRDAIIFGLAKLAESRDPETGDHLERMSVYATRLASALRHDPRYRDTVTPAFVRLIGISSALHDIGKVGIEDGILLKPGRLTDEERTRMQQHTLIGGECLLQIERRLGSSNFLQMAREIALAHHERWDGSGYPNGLAETEIPLAARIVAIADVYDALSSRRTYKEPLPHAKCIEIIRSGAGKSFDPDLVEVWLTIESRFRDIARQYWSATIDACGDETEHTDTDREPALVGAEGA